MITHTHTYNNYLPYFHVNSGQVQFLFSFVFIVGEQHLMNEWMFNKVRDKSQWCKSKELREHNAAEAEGE